MLLYIRRLINLVVLDPWLSVVVPVGEDTEEMPAEAGVIDARHGRRRVPRAVRNVEAGP